MIVLRGKSISEDIRIGKLVFYTGNRQALQRLEGKGGAAEILRYEQALAEAEAQLQCLYEQSLQTVGRETAAVFEAQKLLLKDAEYAKAVRQMLHGQNVNAEYAVQFVGSGMAKRLETAGDTYIRERVQDVRDITQRLINILTCAENEWKIPEEPFIVAAEDLMPSETMRLPKEKVLGFALSKGSVNSHTAILAKSMGVPAVLALGEGLDRKYEGEPVILDGLDGVLYIQPDEETCAAMERKMEEAKCTKIQLQRQRGLENVTRDGRSVKVYANVGSLADVESAIANDAGGIGLLRSELLYLEGDTEPDEETLFIFYRQVLERMTGKEVVVRTFDMGVDKQASYLGLKKEENPALGLRGIRLGLERPELMITQLKALYRAGLYGDLRILYPMVTSTEEIRQLKELERQAKQELSEMGKAFADTVPTGVMIETPAAAILAEEIAREVDFFSIGTNDLAQYTLALDRQNEAVERFGDTSHKAVLRLVEMAAKSAREVGIWVGICGELAADTAFTEKLLEIGIDELSVAPGEILKLRKKIREI